MHYRIAVCDDGDEDRRTLAELTARWAKLRRHTVEISTFPSAENFLFRRAEAGECGFDLLLLDIEMTGMDGVTLAKTLRKGNDNVQIVFITGYADYIAEGYEVEALHYLMKPVKADKFFSVLDRAAEKRTKDEKLLHFTLGGETVRLPVYRIRYAEVSGNYVTLHAEETMTVKMTLGELEKQLDDRFFRAGRSLLVNLTQIGRVSRTELRLLDGTVLPLPRGAYESVNRAIIERT